MDRRMDGRTHAWMDEWMDAWMDGWTQAWMGGDRNHDKGVRSSDVRHVSHGSKVKSTRGRAKKWSHIPGPKNILKCPKICVRRSAFPKSETLSCLCFVVHANNTMKFTRVPSGNRCCRGQHDRTFHVFRKVSIRVSNAAPSVCARVWACVNGERCSKQ